ncbi:MAG: CcdB family protein, partial [Janthinobacterium lividum]
MVFRNTGQRAAQIPLLVVVQSKRFRKSGSRLVMPLLLERVFRSS